MTKPSSTQPILTPTHTEPSNPFVVHSPNTQSDFIPSTSSKPSPINFPSTNDDLQPRRSTRITKTPSFLQDYLCNLIENTIQSLNSANASTSSSNKYPLSSFISYHNVPNNDTKYIFNLSPISEPHPNEEAICDANWTHAIQIELAALMKTNTWKLVTLADHRKAIGCRWVFKFNLYANGCVEIYKARLVANGFTQNKGLEYLDTFSPVVKMTTIRVFMAIAAAKKWPLF